MGICSTICVYANLCNCISIYIKNWKLREIPWPWLLPIWNCVWSLSWKQKWKKKEKRHCLPKNCWDLWQSSEAKTSASAVMKIITAKSNAVLLLLCFWGWTLTIFPIRWNLNPSIPLRSNRAILPALLIRFLILPVLPIPEKYFRESSFPFATAKSLLWLPMVNVLLWSKKCWTNLWQMQAAILL